MGGKTRGPTGIGYGRGDPMGKREERMPVRGGMCIKSGHRESSIGDPRRPHPWPSEKDDDHFVLCVVDGIHPGGSDVVRDAPSTRRFLWYAMN